ncbi:hypothetical protein DEW08_03830 [Azospirillum thermophilum]|uniref:Uncharacterized protein n=1 Tax=Azospirillum thermophilum TaxID=2202148 RepID=A0A2S2CLN0_9PROT|nr:hypothetical protein DEW08_03830 [Azospirillum thermophilum]
MVEGGIERFIGAVELFDRALMGRLERDQQRSEFRTLIGVAGTLPVDRRAFSEHTDGTKAPAQFIPAGPGDTSRFPDAIVRHLHPAVGRHVTLLWGHR